MLCRCAQPPWLTSPHADPRQLQDADTRTCWPTWPPSPIRASRGRHHRLIAILGLAAAAVLACARSIAAIAEWASEFLVTRKTRHLDASPRRFKTVTVHAVTSLPSSRPAPPGSPTCWAGTGRSRRSTPSRCHLRRGGLPGPHRRHPHVMACLRNLVIGVLNRAGPVNVAALRHHARDPRRPLATFGISLG
jgi:hypothetical protein